MNGACRVCELLDKDTTEKDVMYCGLCQANLCTSCRGNIWRRMQAAFQEHKPAFIPLR